MANRWGISKDVEDLVKKRDVTCVYRRMSFANSILTHKTRPTWEQIINDIKINGPENVALCCESCTASKGAKNLIDWRQINYCIKKAITMHSVASIVREHLDL
jgi:hypothetical protein